MNKVDWSRPIQTRDGRKARFLGAINGKYHKRAVAILDPECIEFVASRTENGMEWASGSESQNDIINVPERVLRWVNVYEDDKAPAYFHDREDCAIKSRGEKKCIGLVKLTIEDGKLVSSEVVE